MASSKELITTQRKAGVDLSDWQYNIVVPGATPGVMVKASEADVFGFVLLNAPRKGESAQVAMMGRTHARIEARANGIARGTHLTLVDSGGLSAVDALSATRIGVLLESTDAAGQIAEIFLYPAQAGLAFAMLSGITFNNAPVAGQADNFKIGDQIQLLATFSQAIKVEIPAAGDRSSIGILVGDETRQAVASAGTFDNVETIQYDYDVVDGDLDTNGLSIPADGFVFNDQVFKLYEDDTKILGDDDITHAAVAQDADLLVDGVAPTITGVEITSSPVDADVGYDNGETIEVSVTFSEIVNLIQNVNNYAVSMIVDSEGNTRDVLYVSGSGTTIHVFEIEVESDWATYAAGIGFGVDPVIIAGNAIIQDAATNAVDRGFAAIAANAAHKIRPKRETITTVTFGNSPDANQANQYKFGDVIEIQVRFSGDVTIDDTVGDTRSSVGIVIGGNTRRALRQSADDHDDYFIYGYTVTLADTDTNGIHVPANSFEEGDDVFTSAAGVASTGDDFDHHGLVTSSSRKVKGVSPLATMFDFTSDPGADETYGTGDVISLTFTFDQNVIVDESAVGAGLNGAAVSVVDGATAQTFLYASGSGTTALVFQATVGAGWVADADGLSLNANSILLNNGATIKDSAGNDATITHAAIAAQSGHKVSVS